MSNMYTFDNSKGICTINLHSVEISMDAILNYIKTATGNITVNNLTLNILQNFKFNKKIESFYDHTSKYNINNITFNNTYDAIWCSHILEHQVNPNIFLKKIKSLLKKDGYFGIVVPPRKPFIVGGHVTLWNAGLLLYNLVLAGFDCSKECYIKQYDYNIGIIIRNVDIESLPEDLSMDKGDIEKLSKYFPFEVGHNFNGDIMIFNWE